MIPTNPMRIMLRPTATPVSGGNVKDSTRTIRTDTVSMPAGPPMMAGREKMAKPCQAINNTAPPRLGRKAGSVTVRRVWRMPAPQMRACSSRSVSMLRRPADTSKNANGI